MKKITLFCLIILTIIFSSCNKNETASVEPDWAASVQGVYTVSTKGAGFSSSNVSDEIVVTITKIGSKKIKLVWTDNYSYFSGNTKKFAVASFEVSNTTFIDEYNVNFDDIAKWENSNSKFVGKCVFLGKNLQLTYKTIEPAGSYDSSFLLVKQ
jgi:hypothetical protein